MANEQWQKVVEIFDDICQCDNAIEIGGLETTDFPDDSINRGEAPIISKNQSPKVGSAFLISTEIQT